MMTVRWALPATMTVAALVVLCAWHAGFSPQTAFVWSASIPLDGGWRVYNGQIPHQDFHSPVGYLYLGLLGGCMRWFGVTPDALTHVGALLFIPATLWTWILAQRRFTPWLAGLVTLLLPVHLVTLTIFGSQGADGLSLGGQYSRISWGLFMIAALAIVTPPRAGTTDRARVNECFVTGIIIGMLFGIKVTYVAGLAGLLGLAWCGGLMRLRWSLPAILVGAGLSIAVGLIATGASLSGYLHDLALAQASNSLSFAALAWAQARRIDPVLIAIVLAHGVLSWPLLAALPRPRWLFGLPMPVAGGLAVLIGGHLLSSLNGTETTCPVHVLAILVMQAGVEQARWQGKLPIMTGLSGAPMALCTIVGCALWGQMAYPIAKAAMGSGVDRQPTALARDSVATGPWAGHDWMHSSAAVADPRDYIASLNQLGYTVFANAWLLHLRSGLQELTALHATSSDVVVSLDAINPFPFAAGLSSPKKDHLYWHLGRNVIEATAPSADELFRDATIVMRPAIPAFEDVADRKFALYGTYINANFRRIGNTSPLWTVWVRPDRP